MTQLQISVFFFSLILLCTIKTIAQTTEEKPEIVRKHTCEIGNVRVNSSRIDAEKAKERIFVIFRAGDGETEKTNLRRLRTAKKVLLEREGWVNYSPEIIFAQAEKLNGKGQVEFYIGGKLSLVFVLEKNKTICMHCCDLPGEDNN
jgi:hypothetical protein